MIALFWLDPALFAQLDWLRALLLSGSVGGFSIVLAVVFTTPFLADSGKRPAASDEVNRASRIGLVFGSGIALVGQAMALAYSTKTGQPFKGFVSSAIWITLGIAVCVVTLLYVSETLQGRKRKT
jgi:hypothetical protein